jgi:hypothetical protein
MLEIVTLENPLYWDEIIKSFTQYDVYYLSGYSKGFFKHGDGTPFLLYYHDNNERGICVMMKRDITRTDFYEQRFENNKWFDIVTPYGYGGFLFEGDMVGDSLNRFNDLLRRKLEEENIISVLVRYHPQLQNAELFRPVTDIVDLGKTIEINLKSEDDIWNNMSPKNRTHIRKSTKNGVTIKHGRDKILFEKFIEIYTKTMEHDKADAYYYFGKEFYESIYTDLYDNFEIFYAEYEGDIIAMSIILFANNRMHYHLSGAKFEFRKLAPTNLLLYQAALWGSKQGFKSFHLGGGLGSGEDGLFKFKQAFNRYSGLQFSIGKQIIIPEIYNKLVEIRKKEDVDFDENSSFFPLYRA